MACKKLYMQLELNSVHVSRIVEARKNRRGVVGIESAIVLIAFVIVAAAIAFVVLNAGFATTDKAKNAISTSLSEASSALEVSGVSTGKGNVTASKISAYTVPIKLAGGGSAVDISKIVIRYTSKTVSYDNIYKGALSNTTFASIDDAIQQVRDQNIITIMPGVGAGPTNTVAVLYFATNGNNNDVLDQAEQAVALVIFKDADRPGALDVSRLEVIPSFGAALTVERAIPPISDQVINLN
ncbi:MAG: archaellin/type IV pilin N-terminal domain-containing protein [Nitrososphaera sp.]|uniref:archaellin/type IV pilin N-terminal domain-containing protein n=1 Tax=Nitrososphaera sp. TaxID=1971748 RepID=UPI003D6E4284